MVLERFKSTECRFIYVDQMNITPSSRKSYLSGRNINIAIVLELEGDELQQRHMEWPDKAEAIPEEGSPKLSYFSGNNIRMIKAILHTLIAICSIYVGIVLLASLFQGWLIFQPRKRLHGDPAVIGLPYMDIWLRSSDDVRIHGWYIPSGRQGKTLLFFHGNAGNISHRLDSLAIFHDFGLNILIVDYQGYGNSEGKPSEKALYLDGNAAWNYLTGDLNIPSGDIIVFGRSLGGAVAMELAYRYSPGGIILESSFSDMAEVAAEHFPFLPVRWLLRHRFDLSEKIKWIGCPSLVIHSPNDEIIPFRFGERLFTDLPEPKIFIEIEGDHNTGFLLSIGKYRQGLWEFIRHLEQN